MYTRHRAATDESTEATENPMLFAMKILLILLLLAALATLIGYVAHRASAGVGNLAADADGALRYPTLLLDAGHGGEDGGAEGFGVKEKVLNLQISDELYHLLNLNGYPARRTRTEDVLLYDLYHDYADYTGKKKVFDLKNRLRLAEETADAIFISLHMNSFPESRYKGLQVYYSPNHEASKTIAGMVQSYVCTYTDPGNKREIKKAGSNIYLLDHLHCPAMLIECGFLSNPEECAALKTPEYRHNLTLSMYAAIAAYLESN